MRFRVLEDGSLQQIANQATQAAAGVDRVSEANTRLNRSTRGVSNMQGNTTRAFAAQANGAGGLVAAYATLMAHTFALTAAFGALQRASALDQLEQGLIAVGNAAGQNLPFVARELQNITDGAITLKEAMEATALATSAGFSTSQLEGLTRVAKGASLALGRDMGDALTRLVKGTAKLEPEILDELGIMVRLDEASQKYADSLGVVVGDLSRFQKQQAFLNATLEQGEKKFSMIFENVDAEPFAQLSAQFRDMVKDLTTFLNIGAIPLVKFLSSFPTAMVGGLMLLASSVTKKILPALGDLSARNRDIASVAAAEASRAGRAISTQYVNAVAQVNTAFRTVPQSLRAVEAGFRSGSLSLAEYRAHLVTLQRSESQRAARLNTGNDATRAQRQIELNQIRELRIATEQLIATEGRRGQISSAGSRARSTSHIARRQSVAQDMIGQSGPVEGFRVAARAATGHMATVGRTAGPLNTLRVGFQAAGASAALFGSALLNIVPIIGQVLFFGSLLLPLFGNMFKKSGLAKATDEVTASFSSFAKISAQLADHLRSVKDAEEAFASTLAVRVGITQQITAGVAKMIAAKDEDDLEAEADALTLLAQRQTSLAKAQATAAQQMRDNGVLTRDARVDLSRSTQFAASAEKTYNSIVADNNSVSKESIRSLLAEAKAKAKASGMTEALSIEIAKYNTLVESGVLSGDGNISSAALTAALEGVSKPLAALKQETAGVTELTTKMANETTKATNEQAGKYGEVFDSVNGLRTGLINLADAAEKAGETEIRPVPQDTIAQVERLKLALKLDGEALAGSYVDQLKVIQEKIAANNVLIATSAIDSKKLTDTAKEFGQISSTNASAKEEELGFAKQALEATLAGAQANYDNLAALTDGKAVTNDMLKVQAEIDRITRQIGATANDSLIVDIAKVEQANRLGALNQKILASEKEINAAKLKGIADQAIIDTTASKRAGKKQTPAQDAAARFINEERAIKQEMINSEFTMKVNSINMEYDLLTAKLALEKAIAGRLGEDTKIYDTLGKTMGAAKDSATIAATENLLASNKGLEREGVVLGDKALTEKQGIEVSTASRAFGDNTGMVESGQILGDSMETIKAGGSEGISALNEAMSPMLDSLAQLSPEGEMMSSIATGAFNMMEGFTSAFEGIEDGGSKAQAGVQMAQAALQGLSSIMAATNKQKIAGFDAEIAAEKRKDGQSAQSVAKLKALEAKKEAFQRKAFEKDKKMKMAMVVSSTALAIMKESEKGFPAAVPGIAIMAAMGVAQLAAIAGTSYQGGGSGSSAPAAPSKVSVGERQNTVDFAKSRGGRGELGYMRGEQGIGNANSFQPAFTGYKNRAAGGPAGFVVGEQGPELFVPEVPGSIVPAGETAAGGTPTNVNFTIQAVDAAGVEDLLMAQRSNIIGMIREAANDQGQLFLEGIDADGLGV